MKSSKALWWNCITIIVVVLFLMLPFVKLPKTAQYDIVFLGDSIIGNANGPGGVTAVVGEQLDKSVFNGAFGGTTCSLGMDLSWGSVTSAQWSMVKLADAIAYNDWQSQLGTMNYADYYSDVNAQALYYFEDRMKELSHIDFRRTEVLVIEHGTNDYNSGRPLENPEDLYDITTFGGALRYSLRALQEKYPELTIVLLSPIYCEFGENGEQTCYNWDRGYGTLDAYVQLEKEIAQECGVVFIDAYAESGIWEENAEEYLYDGLHLTDVGMEKLGMFVAERLSQVISQ